jgi:hypothetical protein
MTLVNCLAELQYGQSYLMSTSVGFLTLENLHGRKLENLLE